MAHRRARKDARKADNRPHEITTVSSNTGTGNVQIVDVPVVSLRKPPQPRTDKRHLKLLRIAKRAGGVGLTKKHPIATKPQRRLATRRARASRKGNR